jgi:thioredoxin reductase/SAM-dependent methyltransferase
VPQTPQASPDHLFDVVQLGHCSSVHLANIARWHAVLAAECTVGAMTDHATHRVERHCDVAVIGGSAAGLAAALQLGRQRRSVIVIDAGEPRNGPAAHLHGYLSREGLPPSDLTRIGREEVRSYGGEILDGRASGVTRTTGERFRVELVGGHSVVARRVLAATGVVDELPDIEGLGQNWGSDVIHCPFCHGYEFRDRRTVLIVTDPTGLHSATLFRHLSAQFTVVIHGALDVDDSELDALRAGGVTICRSQVRRIVTDVDGHVTAVELTDHDPIHAEAVVVGPRFKARAEPFAALGLRPVEHPSGLGDFMETDATGATAIPGIYAAGNVADPSQQVLQAAADGSRVGAMISFSLAREDLAAAARPRANQADWDHRYGGDQIWSGNPNGTLVNEASELPPGRALDVGAGEGGDALWLAGQGWRVTASDISQRALERIGAEADRRALLVECHHADANALGAFETGAFDLVSAQYASIPRTPDGRGARNILDAVAPGGTLLVVSHDLEAMRAPIDEVASSRAFDPDAYVRVDDFAAAIADSTAWHIEVHEKRPRPAGAVSASHHVDDVVLRARRVAG